MAPNPPHSQVQYGDMLFDYLDEMKPELHPIRWFHFQFLIGIKDMLADASAGIRDFIFQTPDPVYPEQGYFQHNQN